jgi:NADPH2:quinone reductase
MRAVVVEKLGHFCEVLTLTDVPPIDAIPPGALHILVSACGMGFSDLLQVEGKYQLVAEPPFVPAGYVIGETLGLGSDVDPAQFKIGERVVEKPFQT